MLLSEVYPRSSNSKSQQLIQLRKNLVTVNEEGKLKLDFKVFDQKVYIQEENRKKVLDIIREVVLVVVPLRTFTIEKPYNICLSFNLL